MAFTDSQKAIIAELVALMEAGEIDKTIEMVDKMSVDLKPTYRMIARLYEEECLRTYKISSLPMYDPVISYMLLMQLTLRNYKLYVSNGETKLLKRSTTMFEPFIPDVLKDSDKEYVTNPKFERLNRQAINCALCVVFTIPEHAVQAMANNVADQHRIPSLSDFQSLATHATESGGDVSAKDLLGTLLDGIVRRSDEYATLQDYFTEHFMTFDTKRSYVGARFFLDKDDSMPSNTTHGVSERSYFVTIPVTLQFLNNESINWFPWLSRMSRVVISNGMRGVSPTLCFYDAQKQIILPQDVWAQRIETIPLYERSSSAIVCKVQNGTMSECRYPVQQYNGAAVLKISSVCLSVAPMLNKPVFPIMEGDAVVAHALFTPLLQSTDTTTVLLTYSYNDDDDEEYNTDNAMIRRLLWAMCHPGSVEYIDDVDDISLTDSIA